MKWPKKAILIILMALLAVIMGFYFIGFFTKKAADPWLMIPDNAAIIVEIEQPKAIYEALSGKNEFWKSLLSVEEVDDLNAILGNLDSVDLQNFSTLNNLFSSPFLLSFHPREDSSKFSFLISITNNRLRESDDLFTWAGQILNNSFDIEKTNRIENAIFVKRSGTKNGAFILIYNKTLLISSDYELLEKIISNKQNKEFHFTNSVQFQNLKQTAGKNVKAHLYVNYQNLFSVFSTLLKKDFTKSLDWMDNFAGWSVLDLLVKNDEMLLNGYTDVNNSSQFLAKYSEEIPVSNTIFKVLPSNITFLLNYGSADYSKKIDPEIISELSGKTGLNISNLISALGNEACLASTATDNNLIKENSWFIIKIKDKSEGANYFEQLAKNSAANEEVKYKDFTLKRIGFDELLYQLFGVPIQFIERNWYTMVGEYAVFANSPNALITYISTIELGKTLENNENFTAFSKNLSKSSNINLLLKPNELEAFSDYYLYNPANEKNNFLTIFFNSMNMISFQFSSYAPYFYTSFSVSHSKNIKEEKPYLWKFQLESKLASKLFLVRNAANNSDDIIVLDELFTLYSINSEGKLNWKKRLDSPLLGTIHEINNLQNKTNQLLFNTKDFIYLMNVGGETAPGFPVNFTTPASNGLTTYGVSNEFRMVIAQTDKKVHNYTIDGKPVKGWKLPQTENIVTEQIAYFKAKNKDFFVIDEIDGTAQITDKLGTQIKFNKPVNKALHSHFYENQTNNKGEILTTNKVGKLTYISEKGSLQHTDFGKFSPEHYFLYEDFNGDKETNFIYIDGKKLTVFNRFKKIIFNYTFNSEIKTEPVFHKIDSKQNILALVPENENLIYLFNNKGELRIFPYLPENANFKFCNNVKNELNLFVGSDNSIYFYRLQ